MAHLIDRDALAAEIENIRKHYIEKEEFDIGWNFALDKILSFLDNLEVKEIDAWHSQEKENIYDAVKDWTPYTFACIMKDGTIQKFTGNLDEDYEGHINVHIYGANDDYDNVDEIVKWIEFT